MHVNEQNSQTQDISYTQIDSRINQAMIAAKLKAAAETLSVIMLNERFSEKVGGHFDFEYEVEIKHTPKGLSDFIRNPIVTFYPINIDDHKHLRAGNPMVLNQSQMTRSKSSCDQEMHLSDLENNIDAIYDFIEDEIEPEICKYVNQAKRKNDFTRSKIKSRSINTEKALQVMSSATFILTEKIKLEN